MNKLINHSFTRRGFLESTAAVAGSSILSGIFGNPFLCSGNVLPYDRTLRDRMWMWGHDAGSLKSYKISSHGGVILPAEAIKYMGIPNVCMVPFTGTPAPSQYDEYAKQFNDRAVKRFTWSFTHGSLDNFDVIRKASLRQAARYPNFIGLDMDDFFHGVPKADDEEAPAHLRVEQIQKLKKEMVVQGRKLDLSIVLYSHQLRPAIKKHIDMVDVVYFWTWNNGKDLKSLENNFAAYRKIIPVKRTLLG
ncbi:MAG: hypothetical protein PHR77_15960, partial [Kiritimatiellae bacterium]|nr:hypothetical protein [Kiritimatiellia bacterium]